MSAPAERRAAFWSDLDTLMTRYSDVCAPRTCTIHGDDCDTWRECEEQGRSIPDEAHANSMMTARTILIAWEPIDGSILGFAHMEPPHQSLLTTRGLIETVADTL